LSEILLYAKPQTLHHAPLELNRFIAEILAPTRWTPSAMSRRIEFIPTAQSVTILGDRDTLKQVFINLIDHACEAVSEGEVITWTIGVAGTKRC
jgi:signal transduction histidine kinase